MDLSLLKWVCIHINPLKSTTKNTLVDMDLNGFIYKPTQIGLNPFKSRSTITFFCAGFKWTYIYIYI